MPSVKLFYGMGTAITHSQEMLDGQRFADLNQTEGLASGTYASGMKQQLVILPGIYTLCMSLCGSNGFIGSIRRAVTGYSSIHLIHLLGLYVNMLHS